MALSILNKKFKYKGTATHGDSLAFAKRQKARMRAAQQDRVEPATVARIGATVYKVK